MIARIIPRAKKGGAAQTRRSTRALAAYLLGPGHLDRTSASAADAQVEPRRGCGTHHVRPRVVAGAAAVRPQVLSARCAAVDWADPAAAWRQLRSVAADASVMMTTPLDSGPELPDRDMVWHAALAAHPDDGELTDEQWAEAAQRLMSETGLDSGDRRTAVPWIAVRHGVNGAGADHVHVMAVLVRPDGSVARIHNDVFAAQRTARWAESEFGLTPGKGRTSPTEASQSRRSDRRASRGDAAAAMRTGPPARHEGWSDEVWAWAERDGVTRMWTAQGRAAGAVRSALARAWSPEHMVALLRADGYSASFRTAANDATDIRGWSIIGPGANGRPRSWRGKDLGTDLTWPRIKTHFAVLHEGMGGTGTGIVSREGGGAGMLSAERMTGAGWGWDMIAEVVRRDHGLAVGELAPSEAYWLRDAFWQVAREMEPEGRGPWSDAAYLYSAIAVNGGPPPLPPQLAALLQKLQRATADWRRTDGVLLKAQLETDADRARIDPTEREVLSLRMYPWARQSHRTLARLAFAASEHAALDRTQTVINDVQAAHQLRAQEIQRAERVAQEGIDRWQSEVAEWRSAMGRVLADAEELRDPEAFDRARRLALRFDRSAGTAASPAAVGAAGRR